MWYFLFAVSLIILIAVVVYVFVKDRRALKKRTIETIGDDLWKEIDRERQMSVEKGKQFRKLLKKAGEEYKPEARSPKS